MIFIYSGCVGRLGGVCQEVQEGKRRREEKRRKDNHIVWRKIEKNKNKNSKEDKIRATSLEN